MRKIAILMSFVLMLSLVSCSKKNAGANDVDTTTTTAEKVETTTKEVTTTKPEVTTTTQRDLTGLVKSNLTGLYIDKNLEDVRPFAVMINNHRKAMPQSGIEDADIIYEALAEGGISRLVAVFKDFNNKKIGPVRSARHYFIQFAFDHDALYVHYGQSPQAGRAFKDWNVANLNGLSYLDNIMCYQDPKRRRPHATFTSYEGLNKGLKSKGYRNKIKENFADKLEFNEEYVKLEGSTANKVSLDFSSYQKPWFEYDEKENKYARFQFKGKQIDAMTGNQLMADNIIIQFVKVWNIKGDKAGRLDMKLVGSGKGYYVNGGKYVPITWEKKSLKEPTKYFLESGKPLKLNAGKTWIEVYPAGRNKVTFE